MSPIFTFIVIVLGLLAIANIIVGVANDAINFLNAAWGSRVARYRTRLIVASTGILIGTLTSNGRMENSSSTSRLMFLMRYSFQAQILGEI